MPQRHWVGSPDDAAREERQWLSDCMFMNHQQWKHGASDACAPTMVCHYAAKGDSPSWSLWVGPVDVALDELWLRQMQAAHIFEICESVLRRRASFAATRETFATLKYNDRSRTSSLA